MHIDYDLDDREAITEDVHELQRMFSLGNAVLVETSCNPSHYHAIFFWNNVKWSVILKVLEESKLVDSDFRESRQIQGFNRMRVDGKLNIVGVIESDYHKPCVRGDFYYNLYKRLTR